MRRSLGYVVAVSFGRAGRYAADAFAWTVCHTGRIGRAVIDYLGGFGCEILAYDPFPNNDLAQRGDVTYVGLDELYERSDLISVHVPLMDSTCGIIDSGAIAKMRDGVVLVNVSRGELMDVEALVEGIESEKIGALAMDVFPEEDGIYHVSRTHEILANRNMAYLRHLHPPPGIFSKKKGRHPKVTARIAESLACVSRGANATR